MLPREVAAALDLPGDTVRQCLQNMRRHGGVVERLERGWVLTGWVPTPGDEADLKAVERDLLKFLREWHLISWADIGQAMMGLQESGQITVDEGGVIEVVT